MGKYRYPVVLFLSSLFALAIGLLFRVMHWPGGHLIVGAMFIVQAFAIVWLVILLLQKDKNPKS
jgi:hypothetical protein